MTTNAAQGRVDTQSASPDFAARLNAFFRAKSDHDIERTHAFFHRDLVGYYDATLGWAFPGNETLRRVWEQYMPHWGEGLSYETRVVGDETGGVVLLTDTPELFGAEIRAIAAVDLADGLIVRWVDYWNGRDFGAELTASMRVADADFPEPFGADQVQDATASPFARTSAQLIRALSVADRDAISRLLGPDIVFDDLTTHLALRGRTAVSEYLTAAGGELPYGLGVRSRHIVGGSAGGGIEWVNDTHRARRGIFAVETESDGSIWRMTAVWDGSLLPDEHLLAMRGPSI